MPILARLQDYLDTNQVSYTVCTHKQAFTAQEVAAAQHVKGKELAKVVIVKTRARFLMTVLPATHRIDFSKLEAVLQEEVSLATEEEFQGLFPGCETGAMPPFGNLYGLPVYVDKALEENQEIVFQAGTHVQTVRMRYQDFKELVKPTVAAFAVHI